MELETSTIMLGFFIILLTASIWKIWAFLPNKQLEDDDTTIEKEKELMNIMIEVIISEKGKIEEKEIFISMKEHTNFDKKAFWRFNQNRLNHLLAKVYRENEEINSIQEIYNNIDILSSK